MYKYFVVHQRKCVFYYLVPDTEMMIEIGIIYDENVAKQLTEYLNTGMKLLNVKQ